MIGSAMIEAMYMHQVGGEIGNIDDRHVFDSRQDNVHVELGSEESLSRCCVYRLMFY